MKVNIILNQELEDYEALSIKECINKDFDTKIIKVGDTTNNADINIFISSIREDILHRAKYNILTINPYTFLNDKETNELQIEMYKRIDVVLCKTKDSVLFMEEKKKQYKFTFKIEMVKFTSVFPTIQMTRNINTILYIPNGDTPDNVAKIVRLWLNNDSLPKILIGEYITYISPNITSDEMKLIKNSKTIEFSEKLNREEIIKLRNKYRIQLFPFSNINILESINNCRATKSVSITINEHHNEFVNSDSAVLIKVDRDQFKELSNGYREYYATIEQLKDAVINAVKLTAQNKTKMGNYAFNLYKEDLVFFENSLNKILVNDKRDFNEEYEEETITENQKEYQPFSFSQIKISTKYEKARLIGVRAEQIARGAPRLVDSHGETDPIKIAFMEYDQKRFPLMVIRHMPRGNEETIFDVNKRIG